MIGLVDAGPVYTVSPGHRDRQDRPGDAFPRVWVEGEVSNFKQAASGHLYFTLKDERSVSSRPSSGGATRPARSPSTSRTG